MPASVNSEWLQLQWTLIRLKFDRRAMPIQRPMLRLYGAVETLLLILLLFLVSVGIFPRKEKIMKKNECLEQTLIRVVG